MENLDSLVTTYSPLSPVLFRRLLMFAIFCFAAIWTVDETSGIIVNFDAWAYPICMVLFGVIYLLTYTHWFHPQSLHFMAYVVVSSYLISTSIWHHLGVNGLFSNAAQWLGLNYVIAYLFLEVKKAVPTTIVVFVLTIVGHFIALRSHYSLEDTMGVVMNIGIAHLAYVVLLGTALKLRVDNDSHQARAVALEYYIQVDPLTNLLNRRGIEHAMRDVHDQKSIDSSRYAILMLDIDHFKRINDQYGHSVGDQVLVDFAHTLKSLTADHDVVGRWGGEEFLVITLDARPAQVRQLAERLRSAISRLTCHEGSHITTSIGICYSEEGSTFVQRLDIADNNLYCAKHGGRNQVVCSPRFEELCLT